MEEEQGNDEKIVNGYDARDELALLSKNNTTTPEFLFCTDHDFICNFSLCKDTSASAIRRSECRSKQRSPSTHLLSNDNTKNTFFIDQTPPIGM